IEGLVRQPHLVVVDSRLQTPGDARLFEAPAQGGSRQVWLYHSVPAPEAEAVLLARGAQLRCLPNPQGKVDLAALLRDLGQREVNELHVEAGHLLNGSLLREGLVDELLVYLAPRLLGQGAGLAALPAMERIADEPEWRFAEIHAVGTALRLISRRRGAESALQIA